MERRAEGQCGVLLRQLLPFQCELVLDAGDADAEVVAAAHGAGVHGQVGTVEAGQLFGHLGHVGAVGIAPLHHQRQQRVGRGRLAAGREREVDADAAAVEFLCGVIREVDAGRDLGSSQCSIVLLYYFVCSSARYSSSERPEARMARALSLPTYRQCHGSNTMPVAA